MSLNGLQFLQLGSRKYSLVWLTTNGVSMKMEINQTGFTAY